MTPEQLKEQRCYELKQMIVVYPSTKGDNVSRPPAIITERNTVDNWV
jgi:hypothetical protein